VSKKSVILLCDAVWIEVHNVVPYDADLIHLSHKHATVYLQARLSPMTGIFKETQVFAEGEIGDGFNDAIGIPRVLYAGQLVNCEFAIDQLADMVLNLREQKERL